MELYKVEEPFEIILRNKAAAMKCPFGGAVELLPICNMRCNMCYVRKDRAAVIPAEGWIRIGESLRDAGALMVLFTGGEPLLHPGFQEIYTAFQKMGFVLSVNTNGTLIDEKWADFFYQNPCRRLNVTLYGASGETYGRLCHYPEGFGKTMRALGLLKDKGIPCYVSLNVVKENRADLGEMVRLVKEIGLEFISSTYEFPPQRGGDLETFSDSKMSPREAAEVNVEKTFLHYPEADRHQQAVLFFDRLTGAHKPAPYRKGLPCTAGKSGFWIDWEGRLCSCGMLPEPSFSLKEFSFGEAWEKLVKYVGQCETSEECHDCRKKSFCPSCAAAMYTETGDMRKAPKYLCRMTDEMIKIMFSYLNDAEKADIRDALEACGLIYDF